MADIKPTPSESWLSPEGSRRLAAQLGERLWERCRGRRGLFVTLTYRRDDFKDALDLYRTQSEQQHVPLFLRKVARYLGESLTGRWFCKMEFQGGGWVHFHLIILGVERIDHAACTRMWGHGFVWLRRLSEKNVRYCTKYTVKPGEVPAWLYMERPRSVKITRVSPGFWGNEPGEPEPSDEDYERWGPQKHRVAGIYRPVGETLVKGEGGGFVMRHEGQYRRVQVCVASVLWNLLSRGRSVVATTGRWLVLDCSLADVDSAVAAVRAQHASPPPLHLIQTALPDVERPEVLSWWLDNWYREEAA